MMNAVNHANGITLPDGTHFEARVGATRWFTAERAERALAEVRPEVDKAVELTGEMFGNDAEAAVKAILTIVNDGLSLSNAVGIYSRVDWNGLAFRFANGYLNDEQIAEAAAEWQKWLVKHGSEKRVEVAMAIVKRGHWSFWSKNGWFVESELPEVEEQVAEVAEVEVENNEVAEVAEVEVESEQVESNEVEEVKAEVEEEVSKGGLVGRMFDASNPERAFDAMVALVSNGLDMKKVGGFGLASLNVAGKSIAISQLAYEAKNGSRRFTSEFRQAAVEAWSNKLHSQAERIAEYVKNTVEILGVEVEADEANEAEADEANEAEVETEKGEDEMTAVEVAEAVLDEANPERGLRLAFKKGILPKWFQFTREDYEALDPTDLWITSWNDAAAQLFRNLAGEKEKKVIVETWREHLKSVKPAIKRHSFLAFIEESAKEKARTARKARK